MATRVAAAAQNLNLKAPPQKQRKAQSDKHIEPIKVQNEKHVEPAITAHADKKFESQQLASGAATKVEAPATSAAGDLLADAQVEELVRARIEDVIRRHSAELAMYQQQLGAAACRASEAERKVIEQAEELCAVKAELNDLKRGVKETSLQQVRNRRNRATLVGNGDQEEQTLVAEFFDVELAKEGDATKQKVVTTQSGKFETDGPNVSLKILGTSGDDATSMPAASAAAAANTADAVPASNQTTAHHKAEAPAAQPTSPNSKYPTVTTGVEQLEIHHDKCYDCYDKNGKHYKQHNDGKRCRQKGHSGPNWWQDARCTEEQKARGQKLAKKQGQKRKPESECSSPSGAMSLAIPQDIQAYERRSDFQVNGIDSAKPAAASNMN